MESETQFSNTNQPEKSGLDKHLSNVQNKRQRDYSKENKNRKKPVRETYRIRKENKSRQRAAKQSNLSDETLRKYQYVLNNGSEELVDQMKKAWITINEAYNTQKKEEYKQELLKIV